MVADVRRVNDRLMTIKLVVGRVILNMIRAYALQLVIGGDFNGHIGVTARGYDEVHGGFGYGVRNEGGTSLLDFAKAFYLVIANSCFQKREEHLVTFRSKHRLLVMDLEFKRVRKKRALYGQPKIKWGALTKAKAQELGEKLLAMGA
ncbi:PREDICTED: uncharacterized protein LOC109242999 [Nicotiana attenuata]|uniref:uncharacterized protein LOC109242999 n=1 Tax=Nicotiana attenuata TaxID=49451 RepID=UPI000904CB10|nr:PREDICTED: uncharacterized protein LOC109242999 [Nicotiana attenuata]